MLSFSAPRVESFVDLSSVDQLVQRLLRTFERLLPMAHQHALLDRVIERKAARPSKHTLLPPAPPSRGVLKKGFLNKRGDYMKTWKRRCFRALNEHDNFEISYGRGETGGEDNEGDEIGRFSCCGYR